MIIENRRIEFGLLIKEFREHSLGLNISEFCRMVHMSREQLHKLEEGEKPFVEINTFCFLLDLGFPIHMIKNSFVEKEVIDYLTLERFKKRLNHHRNKKLRFQFDVFCELNREHIEKNYIPSVLEYFTEAPSAKEKDK